MLKVRRVLALCLAALPYLILLAATYYAAQPLLVSAPLTHDHATHLFKAWHMRTQLLPNFRLSGFSQFWAFGFPSDELIPPGEELWVLLFRAVTLEKLDWVRTYGISLFGLLLFTAVATYRFSKQYFGPVAGVISGLLVLWDPGHVLQGGWKWSMEYGVWPITLGACCLLIAGETLEKLLAAGGRRQFVVASLWVAAAFVSHQVAILVLPVMVTLLIADHWLRRSLSATRLQLTLLACCFGVALCAFYLVPMLARSNQTLDLGLVGGTPEHVAKDLVQLQVFAGSWRGFIVLGFVGAVAALRRRVPGAVLLIGGTGIFVFLSTDYLVTELHIERLMPSFRKVEAPRMLYCAKLFWFPLVGYALSLAFEGAYDLARRLLSEPRKAWRELFTRWTLAWCFAFCLMLPYATSAADKFRVEQIEKSIPAENFGFWQDLQKVWAYTAPLRASTREHYRIAYDLPFHDHLSTLAPVFDGTYIYKVGYTPTQQFANFPMHWGAEIYRQTSVKYVVSEDYKDPEHFVKEREFGKLKFYRFKAFDPSPFSMIGRGAAELLEFSPQHLRVRLEDTATDSRLKLHISNFDRWQARVNGKVVPIVPATITGVEDPFLMEIPVADGEVELEYVRRGPEWIGLGLTLGAIPALILGLYLARVRPAWLRWPRFSTRVQVALWGIAAGAAALVFTSQMQKYNSLTALVPKNSVFRELADGNMTVDGHPCQLDTPFSWKCGSATVKAERVEGIYGTHICLTSSGFKLQLTTERKVGSFLVAQYDVRGGGGTIQAWLDDVELGNVGTRPPILGLQSLQFDTREHASNRGTFRLELAGAPLHCFDFRVQS